MAWSRVILRDRASTIARRRGKRISSDGQHVATPFDGFFALHKTPGRYTLGRL
jgi:hypothetical protein